MNLCPSDMPEAHLAPPQANPDAERETVCQPTNQWADEVEAYVERLQRELDAMMATQGATSVR